MMGTMSMFMPPSGGETRIVSAILQLGELPSVFFRIALRIVHHGGVSPRPAETALSAEIDAQTIDACRRGERRALEAVFRRYAPRLERLLTRVVGPGAEVEDLLQTTFIEAMHAFPRFRAEASVATWLSRIAVNTARDHLRRLSMEEAGPSAEPSDHSMEPEMQAARKAQLQRLYECLDGLEAKQRIALVLHVFDGHPIEEVANLMGASQAATKSRIFWARRALLAKARRDAVLAELVPQEVSP